MVSAFAPILFQVALSETDLNKLLKVDAWHSRINRASQLQYERDLDELRQISDHGSTV